MKNSYMTTPALYFYRLQEIHIERVTGSWTSRSVFVDTAPGVCSVIALDLVIVHQVMTL